MANISYWLTVKVKTGQAPQITHDAPVTLKVFFDENHNDDKNNEKLRVKLYAEYSSVTPIGKSSGQQRFDFQITEREYNASTFTLYIWGEPYGYVAFRNNLDKDHVASGRLRLEAEYCKKGGLIDPPPNSQKDDLQIICECDAVQSVVNYIADEMNNNLNSPYLKKIKNEFSKAKQYYNIAERVPTEEITSNLITGISRQKIDIAPEAWRSYQQAKGNIVYSQAINDYACLVHSIYVRRDSDSWLKRAYGKSKNGAQDIYFCGMITDKGGIWDHKPKIYKIWGAKNRLGNADHLFYYDIWSNMHYGFIGKKLGFDDYTLLEGGARAQGVDNANAKGDDVADTEAIKEGFVLSNKINNISIDDLINIAEKHYNWHLSEREKQWEKK